MLTSKVLGDDVSELEANCQTSIVPVVVGAPFCVITLYAAIPIFPRTSVLLEIKRNPLPEYAVDRVLPTADVTLDIELTNGDIFVRDALVVAVVVLV